METVVQKRNIVLIFICLAVLGFIICIASLGSISAEPADPDFYYYYYNGRKIPLTLSKEKVAVRFKQGLTTEEQKAVVESEPGLELFSQREESPMFRLVVLPLLWGTTEEYVIQTIKGLNNRDEIEGAFPIFVISSGEIVSTDEFIVKFGPNVSKAEIDAFNTLNGVKIEDKIEWIEHYILRVKDPKNINTLKMANLYSENPITVFSVFNYIVRTKDAPSVPNDKYFDEDKQWPLDNWGQVPPGGTNDADIDAPEGWGISTGSSDIVIAVLDTGVDLAHEDLVNKLVDGYDAYDQDYYPSPGAHFQNAHGTACAGLAAAETDNYIGIAGVGWDCSLMPIKVAHVDDNGTWNFTPESFTRGIDWAANHGADVLSCSVPELGDNPNPGVQDAIRRAKNDGRGGRGCVIVIAAHNYNREIKFPSAYPEVITVGATDHDDVRWYYSNFGPELDVVAPSAWGSDAGVIMWTTDITGGAGYNPNAYPPDPGDDEGDYTKWFGGTSAATPQVAGLAALILSINPDLTADEVQFIIEFTADDLGDSGWDQYYGWGRINNEGALLEAGSFSINDTLFGWWKFDETSGTTAEDSIGDNNGDLIGDPQWWVDGKINGALHFDGDDYVELSYAVDALKAGPVTVSAWIKADNLTEVYYPIVSTFDYDDPDYYGYLLYVKNISSKYKPRFYIATGTYVVVESDVSIDTIDWYHIAGTYDGSELKIYVNGVVKNEPANGFTGFYEDYDNTYIGYEDYVPSVDGAVYFDGKIDDVRVYRRALDIFEIWDIMFPDTDRFRIKNILGKTVACFDSLGNLFLKGSLTTEVVDPFEENPDHDEFIVKHANDDILALIDTTDGNMYIKGEAHINQTFYWGIICFTVVGFDEIAYIDDEGNLWTTGELFENVNP